MTSTYRVTGGLINFQWSRPGRTFGVTQLIEGLTSTKPADDGHEREMSLRTSWKARLAPFILLPGPGFTQLFCNWYDTRDAIDPGHRSAPWRYFYQDAFAGH